LLIPDEKQATFGRTLRINRPLSEKRQKNGDGGN
jgi:hypothetical protein